MYILRYFFKGSEKIVLTNHALRRAYQRGIDAELIRTTLMSGNCKGFGKSNVKFCKKFKRGTIFCIGVKRNSIIVIKTVELR